VTTVDRCISGEDLQEDQRRYDERIDALHATKAKLRFPQSRAAAGADPAGLAAGVGDQSGRGYRPMDGEWARSLRDACAASHTPFFTKQIGSPTAMPAWQRWALAYR
jgi:protein gp37